MISYKMSALNIAAVIISNESFLKWNNNILSRDKTLAGYHKRQNVTSAHA